jgi:integrase
MLSAAGGVHNDLLNAVVAWSHGPNHEEVIMGELRDQIERDMRVRDFSMRTIEAYVAAVRRLAKYYRKAPDTLSDEEIHRYLIYVNEERKLSASSRQQIRCGLRFFYEVTVRRPQACLAVPVARQPQKLPEILSRKEVSSILEATRTLRERLMLMLAYGGGLRVSEVVHLRWSDLNRERGVIRIEQGKGKKDRYTVLPRCVVETLDRYRKVYPPKSERMFTSRRDPHRALDITVVQKIYYGVKRAAGVEKQGGPTQRLQATAGNSLARSIVLRLEFAANSPPRLSHAVGPRLPPPRCPPFGRVLETKGPNR